MDMSDWSEAGAALGALAAVLLPLLLARWLIHRHEDEPGDAGQPPEQAPDSQSGQTRCIASSTLKGHS